MRRIRDWYLGLGRGSRIALFSCGAVLAVAVAVIIVVLVNNPSKVQVRYGTIVRDPIDNYVWEDNTQTAWVDPSEAGNYRIEYIDKYSPEHEEQIRKEKEEAAAREKELEESSGYEAIESAVPAGTFEDMQTLQRNIQTMGQDIVSGMQMANEISNTKSSLVYYRNQVATMPLPPEIEPLRQQALQVFDMYIKACDLYLQAIATGELALVDEANSLVNEATSIIQGLLPSY
ncbi:MAG: hypothetical protein HPY75_02245 [Actinobacteria bacterium]|nr:hypothetical protein [Actinomycetota bacterium]